MFSKTISAVLLGMRSDMITVEADVSGGLPYFEMVGYLSAEVKEAKERVRTAIRNAGFKLEPRRIIVNLSPADVRKSGTICDLAIASAWINRCHQHKSCWKHTHRLQTIDHYMAGLYGLTHYFHGCGTKFC